MAEIMHLTDKQEKILESNIAHCREHNIVIPTYAQMRNPGLIPQPIKDRLKCVGLWDLDPLNLFRITWKNEPVEFGGSFGGVNYFELPSKLTGVKARIIILIGKYFPTGAHKVGATFGPLVEKLISGRFDPAKQKALWPSTGNYCRGGAYDSYLLGCESIAVLPEGMSRERFDWLNKIGAEVIATPGSESNVKEIYDKVKALQKERGDEIVTLNQFAEFGNPLWHYAVTGPAIEEVFKSISGNGDRLSAVFLTQGSAGTLGCTDYIKEIFPGTKACAGEALQCPTLLMNGYGAHRIEGIGDKHIPWIHNIKNMDAVVGIDDEPNLGIMRLFNDPAGKEYLTNDLEIDPDLVSKLHLMGISSIANMMGSIKLAKYYEMDKHDVIFTVATDSMDMYQSRLAEQPGMYDQQQAAISYHADLLGLKTDHVLELDYYQKKRIHNLKYFTWVEQQGKTVEELDAQWYDYDYWKNHYQKAEEWDKQIEAFNERTGVLKNII